MKTDNVIRDKSFAFSILIINESKRLVKEREYVLSKQLLRSGTAIGANIEEAIGAYSRLDFLHKMTIAYKEARETLYWIRLMHATNYLSNESAKNLIMKADELCKILGKIQITVRTSMKR